VPEQVVLSVRGEARRTVAPDFVVLHGRLSSFATSKGEALAVVRAAQDALVAGLRRLGGVPLAVDSERSALTWSVGSISSHDERDFDPGRGAGRVFAAADVAVTARDQSRLPEIAEALGRSELLQLHGASWYVDPDNPAWRGVRAAAIAAAVAKGRDYAAALGGTLRRVEEVADAGLLGADERADFARAEAVSLTAFGGSPGTPTLDPVPQELHAVIEARLIADVPPLD